MADTTEKLTADLIEYGNAEVAQAHLCRAKANLTTSEGMRRAYLRIAADSERRGLEALAQATALYSGQDEPEAQRADHDEERQSGPDAWEDGFAPNH